jgi:hypothetical protein
MNRRKFLRNVLAGVAFPMIHDQERTIPTKPGYPPPRMGSPSRPGEGGMPFHKAPFAATYAERRNIYLNWASKLPTAPDRGGLLQDLLKLETGAIQHPSSEPLQDALQFVQQRLDPSDFTVAVLIRLFRLHHMDGKLTREQAQMIRNTLTGYKYELDEPGRSETELFTENHQILSKGSELLAGEMFSDSVFSIDGKTGLQHMEKARAHVMRWIDYHARTGMAEWDSIPYYNMDIAALLNLAEFSEDHEVKIRASMLVDLLLFDAVVDSFYGQYGSSHGRTYVSNIRSADGDSLMTLQALAFGIGRIQSVDMASVMLVTGRNYSVPPVLEAIARDHPAELNNYERHSIPLDAASAKKYGRSLTNVNDFEFWWGMGAFSNPPVINLTVDAINRYDLWNYPDFKPYKTMAMTLRRSGVLPMISEKLDPDTNGSLLSEVNKITYRTPDAMLSSAQDFRPGERGYQQHIWQATLGPYAVVFVTNPATLDVSSRPNYWAGNGCMPRNAQHGNVLISIFNIKSHVTTMESPLLGFTHAYFPKWAFDEVREVVSSSGAWIFGRVGEGYVALYSHNPYRWVTDGPDADQEIVAPGLKNVWICQIGGKDTDGHFTSFVRKLSQAKIRFHDLNVAYKADGQPTFHFGWSGSFKVDGKVVNISNYPRWSNPYTRASFGDAIFRIKSGSDTLNLNFITGSREISIDK